MIWDYAGQIHAPDGQCRGRIDLRIVAYFFVLQNIYAHMQIFEKYIYMHIAYGPTQIFSPQKLTEISQKPWNKLPLEARKSIPEYGSWIIRNFNYGNSASGIIRDVNGTPQLRWGCTRRSHQMLQETDTTRCCGFPPTQVCRGYFFPFEIIFLNENSLFAAFFIMMNPILS